MPSCIVKGCTYSWKKKDPDIIIHAFPKDLESIKQWLLQTRQDFGDIDEFSRRILEGTKGAYRVCSRHFTADSYETRGFMTVLKKGAVPTIFPTSPGNPARCKKGPTKRLKGEPKCTRYGVPGVGWEPPAAASWHPAFMSPLAGSAAYEHGRHTFTAGGHWGIPHDQSRSFYTEHGGQNIKEESEALAIGPVTGQIHQSTNTDPHLGTANKTVQANRSKPHSSVGIQCNMAEPPAPEHTELRPLRISLRHFDVLIWVDPFRGKSGVQPKALDLD